MFSCISRFRFYGYGILSKISSSCPRVFLRESECKSTARFFNSKMFSKVFSTFFQLFSNFLATAERLIPKLSKRNFPQHYIPYYIYVRARGNVRSALLNFIETLKHHLFASWMKWMDGRRKKMPFSTVYYARNSVILCKNTLRNEIFTLYVSSKGVFLHLVVKLSHTGAAQFLF